MIVKLNYLILLGFGLCCEVIGQNFEIPIYFEDSAGFKDTIVLGYDSLASYDIDTSFGEINIAYFGRVDHFISVC